MSGEADARDGSAVRSGPRAWPVDVLLAVGVTAVVALVISANQGGRTAPDAIAYLWALGLGALMLVRRRWPRTVLAISVLGLFAYYAAGYPAIGVAVPVAAAVYSAAEMGRLVSAIVGGAVVVVVSVGFRLIEGQAFTFVVGYELAGHVLLLAAAIALGDSVRSRRRLAASARRLVASTAEQARERARSEAHAARTAIARDLHDSVGHAVTVISLHADVAAESLGRDDDGARVAIGVVKDTSRQVMAELRGTVRRLREPDREASAQRSIDDLRALVRDTRLEVDARIEVTDDLDPRLADAAFRIVQESLTNIARHVGPARTEVGVLARDGALTVTVVDDGGRASADLDADGVADVAADAVEPTSAPAPPTPEIASTPRVSAPPATAGARPGLGLLGMRERVAALGGTLMAGVEGSGFAVRAVLPLERAPGGPS